jgi:chemotaxis regulatin CheY-phosphate phosphatase CheZ
VPSFEALDAAVAEFKADVTKQEQLQTNLTNAQEKLTQVTQDANQATQSATEAVNAASTAVSDGAKEIAEDRQAIDNAMGDLTKGGPSSDAKARKK